MSNDQSEATLSRRNAIKFAGIAVAGVLGQNHIPVAAAQQAPNINKNAGAPQPTLLPPADSVDPLIHSRAENLFWTQAMMEHASFFAMLMPGPELAPHRTQAENFQRTFQNHLDRTRTMTLDKSNYASLNRSTVELIKPLIEYKQRMLDAQDSGKIRTLVFSLFFDHTVREAQRAAARLERISTGDVALNYSEVIDFWSAIMSDHSNLIAHLLDPKEQELIGQALDAGAVFQGFKQGNYEHAVRGGDVLRVTEELVDFHTVVAQGLEASTVKSIIDPVFAAHIGRETHKFIDELKRSGNKT
jgi:hypothetical protein